MPHYLADLLCSVCRNGSVGSSTRYGLDGPGTESRWRQDFPHPYRPALGPTQHPYRPALGPTQPPVQRVTGFFTGIKRPGRGVDHPPASSAEVKERVVL